MLEILNFQCSLIYFWLVQQLYCVSSFCLFLFLIVFLLFLLPEKYKIEFVLAIPIATAITLVKEIIDISPLAADKTIKFFSI